MMLDKRKKLTLLGALLVLAVGVCAGVVIKGRSGIQVETLEVTEENFLDQYTEDGVIHRGQQYKILSRVSGTVLETAVEENTEVHAGDLIMKIDSRDLSYEQQLHQSAMDGYQAQIDQSQISQLMSSTPTEYLSGLEQELQSAEAALQLAQTNWTAGSTLYGNGVMSRVDMEQAKAAYEQAKAEKEKAENRLSESRSRLSSLEQQGLTKSDINERFYESTLEQLRALLQSEQTTVNQLADQLADCEITADRDGIISSFAGKELSAVQAGQEVAVISGTSDIVEAEAQVLTTIAPYIKVGDPVTVTQKLRGQELSYSGKITEVYDFANQTTSALGLKEYRVTVKAVLETEGTESLKDGYGIDMNFTLYQGENCLVIPAGAVFHFQDQDYVYAVEVDRAVKRAVTLEYQSGTQAVVKEGIEKGTVLIENVDEKELYDGVRVASPHKNSLQTGKSGIISDVLLTHFDQSGDVARFGGDEFGIIFDGDMMEAYEKQMDAVKKELDHIVYESEGRKFNITVSFGLADVARTNNFSEAVHLVDKELYYAKRKKLIDQNVIE